MKPPLRGSANELASDGVRLMRKGKLKAAARALKKSLRQNPRQFEALEALGVLRGMVGDIEEAAKLLQRAMEVDPSVPSAPMNLGLALLQLSRPAEAVAAFETAARLNPSLAQAHERLGDALLALGRLDEAAASFARAVAREPDNAQALTSLVETKRKQCDWDGIETLESQLVALVTSGQAADPLLLLHVIDDPALLKAHAMAYWDGFFKRGLPRDVLAQKFEHKPRSRERIRIAYLSADYREHATAYLMAELFELHDRARFEVIGLSYGPDDGSATRRRLEAAFDTFIDLRGAQSNEAARKIWSLGVDIAVDLKGYTAYGRPEILLARPAPVQCHWIGYPGTLGTDFIDYNIVDAIVAPAGAEQHFTERLVRLPGSYQVNDRKRAASPAVPSREACGLPADAFVFSSFNNPHKLTPAVFDVWMRILRAVPGSVLWLYSDNKWAPENLGREAAARGIDPSRLVFAGPMPLPDHLARLGLADLLLDTLPYGAHTTASDALWVGLPVLTCAGAAMQSRVCASLLTAVGMPELITTSLDEYERLAVALAIDPPRLAELKNRLKQQGVTKPLFDTEAFCRNLESAYRQMWGRWLKGERPLEFAVGSESCSG